MTFLRFVVEMVKKKQQHECRNRYGDADIGKVKDGKTNQRQPDVIRYAAEQDSINQIAHSSADQAGNRQTRRRGKRLFTRR